MKIKLLYDLFTLWFSRYPRHCTVGQKKKKRNTPIYFNTNYRKDMKLVPQFDGLFFFLGVRLHGGLYLTNFFNVNPQIFHRNPKVHLTNRLERNFHNVSNIS